MAFVGVVLAWLPTEPRVADFGQLGNGRNFADEGRSDVTPELRCFLRQELAAEGCIDFLGDPNVCMSEQA